MRLNLLDLGVGIVILAFTALDVIGTLVVPRSFNSRISKLIARFSGRFFRTVTRFTRRYETIDAVEAWSGPVTLMIRLTAWVALLLTGFAFLLLPAVHGSFAQAYTQAGSSMFTLGYSAPVSSGSTIIDYVAAYSGLLVVALQIGYLPTLYAAFNRREVEVTMLGARAGSPAWGPELLLRTRYGITEDGRNSALLDELFDRWERWSAEVAESHTTYPTLIFLRSPSPYKHWLTSQLAILDAAAIHLSVAPSLEPRMRARLCLRAGFEMLRDVGGALGMLVDLDPDPNTELQLTYAEFEAAVADLIEVGYPCEVSAEEAWPHFRGWRVNYESLAYRIGYAVDAPPAKWSGPRRWTDDEIAPYRPSNRLATQALPRQYP